MSNRIKKTEQEMQVQEVYDQLYKVVQESQHELDIIANAFITVTCEIFTTAIDKGGESGSKFVLWWSKKYMEEVLGRVAANLGPEKMAEYMAEVGIDGGAVDLRKTKKDS